MPIPGRCLCASTVLLALLGGCAALEALPPAADLPVAQEVLLERMDRCLQQQEAQQEQLRRQVDLLQEQSERLDAVVASASKREATPGSVAVVPPVPRCSPAGAGGKLVVGELEQVWFPNLDLALPARVDTGAETASLDARDIQLFERNGERWVRFRIVEPESDELIELERKVSRRALIVQSNTAERERRPVIKLSITIGHIHQPAEFTLSDRSHLDYQVLVGRNILKDVMVVDVSKKNVAPHGADAEGDGGAAL